MTRIRAAIARRPAGALLVALIAGELAGPRWPAVVLGAAAVVLVLAPDSATSVVLLLALLCGAELSVLRADALRPRSDPLLGHVVRAVALVVEPPRATLAGWRATVVGRSERIELRGRGPAPALAAGDRIAVRGVLRAPSEREGWLVARHVGAVLDSSAVRATGLQRGGPAGLIDGVRRRATAGLEQGLSPPQSALLRGMVLGDDSAISAGDRLEMRRAGLGHLVAASGANVALLATLALACAAATGLGQRARIVGVLVLIAAYVPLAGDGPSIRRAGVMGVAALVAALASRPADRVHALLLAAALTLAADPSAAGDPGWQLSFAAVVAIAVLAGPIAARLRALGLAATPAAAAAMTLAATLGTAPVGVARFGSVSVAGIPANLAVAAAVAPITWLGMLAALLAQVWAPLARPLTLFASPLLGFVGWVAHVAAGAPGAQLAAGVPLTLLVSGLCAWALLARRGRAVPVLALVATIALMAGVVFLRRAHPPAPPVPGTARVSFLDIGQGDATLLQAGGAAVLVDSGPPGAPIVERLRQAGIRRLDVLVATHAQADHDGGADQVLHAMPVGLVLDGRDGIEEPQGRELELAAAGRGVRLVRPAAGDVLRVGAIRLDVLSPARRAGGPVAGADPNQRAIVLLAQLAGLRVLLTADAESDVLTPLHPAVVDVLKLSHHGSADPGLEALLRQLRPRLAVIEVGAGNTYGHPTAQALGALRAAGVPVRRTDIDGTVRVDRDAAGMRVHGGS